MFVMIVVISIVIVSSFGKWRFVLMVLKYV